MNIFRNVADQEPVKSWWDNTNNQIAFSRGDRAFIAINNDNADMNMELQTNLQAGNYCDIISGAKLNNSCTGKTIKVDNQGLARILIKFTEDNPIVAIHLDSKLL